jgi:hypothetical protein
MNIQVLDKLFDVADDLNYDLTYGDFCRNLVPNTPEDGVLCHGCRFYKNRKDGCMLCNALKFLDDAKDVYKFLIKNNSVQTLDFLL